MKWINWRTAKFSAPNGDRITMVSFRVSRRARLRIIFNHNLRNFSCELLRRVSTDYWEPKAEVSA